INSMIITQVHTNGAGEEGSTHPGLPGCASNRSCFFVCLFALFVTSFFTYFVHNVAATVSSD
ncbi:hypothetical protein ACP3WT_28200, partial [Salmonella enterica]|uniref:hypothetical protein n=1 Tax=Salmonella enterica TaxID=28901 RepID=UPI003CFA3B7F